MKKYLILESWHNGCDNAVDELYATCERYSNAKELLLDFRHWVIDTKSIGQEFRKPKEGERIWTLWDEETTTLSVWIGKVNSYPCDSEFRRSFRIVEEERKWDFVLEQESKNPAYYGFYTGLISNGKDFLFYRANREDNICEVFGSIEEMCGENSKSDALCSYPWNAENASILLSVLNNNPFKDVYIDDNCDQSKSILRTIEFK